jgi:hypothetical protein
MVMNPGIPHSSVEVALEVLRPSSNFMTPDSHQTLAILQGSTQALISSYYSQLHSLPSESQVSTFYEILVHSFVW